MLNGFPLRVKISLGTPGYPIHEKDPANLLSLTQVQLNHFQNKATFPPGPNDLGCVQQKSYKLSIAVRSKGFSSGANL